MTSPIVILEGPDGAGKSTLARELSTHLDVPVMHLGPPPEGISATDQCLSMIMNQRTQYMGAIMDRFHLGERVYGPIMRGIDTLGDEGQHLVETGLRQLGARQIICLPPLLTCIENWQARQASEYVPDQVRLAQVWLRYHDAITMLPTLRYDYTVSSIKDVLKFLGAD